GTCSGGSFDSIRNGGGGTVYLKPDAAANGDLLIDNNNIASPENSTPLPSVAIGEVLQSYDTLNANELIDNDANFIIGALVGLKLNPAPSGSQVFTISGNSGTSIFTGTADGDMTQYGSGSYIGVHLLFNLTIKGNAHVFTFDRIVVSGTLTVEPGSSLKAENHDQ
ncbi:MAG: hypothetical protein KAT34_17975, partial [Candidatus Aminicenantes bacterium]|nr:hypothetical protein [Candidatus Aminicenantes bacterium]